MAVLNGHAQLVVALGGVADLEEQAVGALVGVDPADLDQTCPIVRISIGTAFMSLPSPLARSEPERVLSELTVTV